MGQHKLNGTEKTAILLMSLGEELAGEIFRRLPELEVKRIASTMTRLGRIDVATVTQVSSEFQELLQRQPQAVVNDPANFARRALGRAFPGEKGAAIGAAIPVSSPRLDVVDTVDAKTIATLIQGEHPQTIALVLAFCEAKKAGDVMKRLPSQLHIEVLLRLAKMDQVAAETIEDLNEHLKKEVSTIGSRQRLKLGGADKVAAILGKMDSTMSKSVLQALGERTPPLAAAIEKQLFTFDDLADVPDEGIRVLLARVAAQDLRVAMRSCRPAVLDAFYRNMSPRAAKVLQDDIAAMKPMRVKDIELAQEQIMTIARGLEESGLIQREGGEPYL